MDGRVFRSSGLQVVVVSLAIACCAAERAGTETWPRTHEQVGTITIPVGEREVAIRSFCLDGKDNLLAACGGERVAYTETDDGGYDVKIVNEPAAIRVIGLAGEFRGLVGTATIVPGCLHVAIGVSRDGSRVYQFDITRSTIIVMERRGTESDGAPVTGTR